MDGMVEVSHWLGPLLASCSHTIGGWWTERSVPDALGRYTPNDDTYYRAHFAYIARTTSAHTVPTFAEARPAYLLGHLAGMDPELDERNWADIEPTLESAWTPAPLGEWIAVSRYARAAFRRSASAEQHGSRARQGEAETLPLEAHP